MTQQNKSSQYQLLKEIQAHGINIVSCGSCGSVILHRATDTEIECYDCKEVFQPDGCADLFHEEIQLVVGKLYFSDNDQDQVLEFVKENDGTIYFRHIWGKEKYSDNGNGLIPFPSCSYFKEKEDEK